MNGKRSTPAELARQQASVSRAIRAYNESAAALRRGEGDPDRVLEDASFLIVRLTIVALDTYTALADLVNANRGRTDKANAKRTRTADEQAEKVVAMWKDMKPAEIAAELGVTERTVWAWKARGLKLRAK